MSSIKLLIIYNVYIYFIYLIIYLPHKVSYTITAEKGENLEIVETIAYVLFFISISILAIDIYYYNIRYGKGKRVEEIDYYEDEKKKNVAFEKK